MDIAALRAAKSAGLPTGGFMPKGFRTLDGPHPDWAKEFNLAEMATDSYKARTWENVRSADATIRIARNFRSRGEICTENAIIYYHKPDLGVFWDWPGVTGPSLTTKEVATWIFRLRPELPQALNFAGNAMFDLEQPVEQYLTELFVYVAAILK